MIESSEFDPDYEIYVDKLEHSSGYYFVFENEKGFASRYSPAKDRIFSGHTKQNDWAHQLSILKSWLAYLRREIDSPNLWESIIAEKALLDAGSTSDNSGFSSDELAEVLRALGEIKEYLISAQNFDRELVEPQLKYLAESAERLGRKDFKNLLLGVVTNLVINAAAPPETVRAVFRFVGTALKIVLQQPGLLPAVGVL